MTDVRNPHKKPQSLYQSAWLPVGLLTVTTAALGVPLVLLRRAKRNPLPTAPPRRSAGTTRALAGTTAPTVPSSIYTTNGTRAASENFAPATATLLDAPPPRRMARSSVATLDSGSPSKLPFKPLSIPISSALSGHAEDEEKELPKQPLEFNDAFYAFRAFAFATGAVFLGAATTVFGASYYLGIDNPEEFARWARWSFASRLPWLYSRMRRPIVPDTEIPELPAEPWTWEGAESRMQDAWESKGLLGWAEVVGSEIEAEGREERAREWRRSPQSPQGA